MPEDLIIKYLKAYSKSIKNIWFIKKLHLDNYLNRFKYTLIIIILFIISCFLNIIGFFMISNFLYLFLLLFFTLNISIWFYIDIYKAYKFKRLCYKLNLSRLEIKKLLKRYRL